MLKPISPTAKPQHRYNWKADKHDPRDFLFALKMAGPQTAPLPASVDLTSLCSPVFDQGDMGSCTANALAGLFEFAELGELRAKAGVSQASPELFETKYDPVSRLFIYYGERVIDGTVDQDSGAQIRDGIKVLSSQGVCRESIWAYEDSNLYLAPSAAANAEAAGHKIQQYSRLLSFLDMKHCLAAGRPFAFGMIVSEDLESPEVAVSGILPMPDENTQFIGGHAIMCVGYNDATQRVKIRNSWGADWAKGGYFEMPYAYIASPELCQDYWTLIK